MQVSSNNKRIAKNTLYLYARMLIVMFVSLFTVRIVLQALGVEDYGINNVVGGVVSMFSFLTSTMISASQRFFAYTIGRKDYRKLSDYFVMSTWFYIGMAVVIIILAETLGLWFVQTKLNIPDVRKLAAFWVYQFSVITFIVHLLSIPYTSIIIAREKMNVYAVVGLVEVFSKLVIAYLMLAYTNDKLILYASLMCIMSVLINGSYVVYGLTNFPECRLRRYWSKSIFREVISYSFWSLFGAISGVFRSQGINILLNIFFNPIVNAARAIAYQVNSTINQFVLNFFKAVQPQITKYYAASDHTGLIQLMYRSSRYCYYLILILSLPVLLETPFLLNLWLDKVPEGTILFTRLVVITAIIDSTAYPLQTATAATGKIKWYQIITGGLLILNLPISWIFLKFGYPPEVTMYVAIIIAIVSQISRILFSKRLVSLSIRDYTKKVVIIIGLVTAISVILPTVLKHYLDYSWQSSVIVMVVTVLWTCIASFFIGIPGNERKVIHSVITSKIRKQI